MKLVDLHCDTLDAFWWQKERGEHYNLYKREGHIDIVRMQQNDYLMQCFAVFVHMERAENVYEHGKKLVQIYKQLCAEYSMYIAPMHHFSDIEENRKKGLITAMLTIEEGGVLQGSLEKLREFYEDGVRMITLTWNFPNEIGYPSCLEEVSVPEADLSSWKVTGAYPGLTKKGMEIVQTMEEKGIIVDVSHLSDAGFWDVAAITKKPFVASHSNARSVCSHKRNLSDMQIRTLAERGGVMGLNYAADFLENNRLDVSMDSFIRNIQHIIQVGGEDVLALGSDFDGIEPNPAMLHMGMLPNLFDAMKRAGIKESVIDKIKGQNALRMVKEVIR